MYPSSRLCSRSLAGIRANMGKFHSSISEWWFTKFKRIRMGIAFSIVGVSLLVGTPIEGALLRLRLDGYEWHRAVIFCGVSTSALSRLVMLLLLKLTLSNIGLKVMVLCGASVMTLSRFMFLQNHPSWQARRVWSLKGQMTALILFSYCWDIYFFAPSCTIDRFMSYIYTSCNNFIWSAERQHYLSIIG